MRMRNWVAPGVLVVIGTVQMAGEAFGVPALKGLGAATGSSPTPKVFTAQEGFETYSSRFFIAWTDRAGVRNTMKLAPSNYRVLRGPYNRRNAYGAAISYAPVLQSSEATRAMLHSAMWFAFCSPSSTVLEELGLNAGDIAGPVTVIMEPRQDLPADHGWQLEFEMDCNAQ